MRQGVRVHTILFTEACPLNCKYCDLKNGDGFGTMPQLTFEEVYYRIKKYDEQDTKDNIQTRFIFTGGEPLLYWDWIKKIIEEYGDYFEYEFNTSGYLLTEDILIFLSHYKSIKFYLSVDGNEALTNYLRPTNDTKYRTGYMKQFKKIVPTLLYYFPATAFKIIVNPRYVDLTYESWRAAIDLGFKEFFITLDFESRPTPVYEVNKPHLIWNNKHTQILKEQVDLIVKDIITGFNKGIDYPRITNLNDAIKFLLNYKKFNTKDLPCQIFAGRTLSTLYQTENTLNQYCLTKAYPNRIEAEQKLYDFYNKHTCKYNKDCMAFEFCIQTGCPQFCLKKENEEFYLDELDCVLKSIFYEEALKFLYIGNNMCKDSYIYKNYIQTLYDLKEE